MPTVTLNLPETTFVSSAGPDSSFSFYPVMAVGADPGFQDCIGLVNVALPDLPKSVESAVLQLSVIVKSGAEPETVAVSQLSAAFNPKTVTWNSMPSLIPTETKFSVSASELYTSIQADITDVVNAWLSGAAVNHGIALIGSDGTIVQFATNNIAYEPYFPKLMLTYSGTPVPRGQPYGYIYNTDGQSVDQEAPIRFTENGPLCKVTHNAGSGEIKIEEAGLYLVWYRVTCMDANQFSVFQNAAVLRSSAYGSDTARNFGTVVVNALAGDTVTLRNHTSGDSVTLFNQFGGSVSGVSAALALLKTGPNLRPDSLLTAVNAAQTNDEMLESVADPSLRLDLSAFNQLPDASRQYVLAELIANRPPLGYLTVPDVQAMLNYEVSLTELDPNNIYVRAGAAGGNGSLGMPFGDIQTGIDAVEPGGTVHVWTGIYPVSGAIRLNKESIEVTGEGNPRIVRQTEAPGMDISGSGSVVMGLTFTGTNAFQSPYIVIHADRVVLFYNTAFDPGQSRLGVGTFLDGARDGVSMVGNQFYNLERGISMNSDCTGSGIVRNTISTCSVEGVFLMGGFNVDSNYWGAHSAEDDIGIRSGNYDVVTLRLRNHHARVRDYRQ